MLWRAQSQGHPSLFQVRPAPPRAEGRLTAQEMVRWGVGSVSRRTPFLCPGLAAHSIQSSQPEGGPTRGREGGRPEAGKEDEGIYSGPRAWGRSQVRAAGQTEGSECCRAGGASSVPPSGSSGRCQHHVPTQQGPRGSLRAKGKGHSIGDGAKPGSRVWAGSGVGAMGGGHRLWPAGQQD